MQSFLKEFGDLESLIYRDVPKPEVGHVVIQVKEFGINHTESPFAGDERVDAATISGIECVGLVKL